MSEKEQKQIVQDDFWDLSDLVPKRKSSPAMHSRLSYGSTEAVEIRSPSHRIEHNASLDVPLTERFVHPQAAAAELLSKPTPEAVYSPSGGLVREVRIYPWNNEYTYYEQFRHHAERLADREGKECPEVDFFSYMPQYSQLSMPQLEYYLWWRTNFRRGICLPAAYSYLLLYLYELINLDEDHQNPQTGQDNMLRLWLSYREKHPRLDVLIREWLCDYSLLHRLSPPRLDPACYRTLLSGCRLKEFYVSADGNVDALSTAMLLFCNNYDYTKSKFYRADTKEDFDRILGGAICEALDFLREQRGGALTDLSGVSTLSRDTFTGAVCSWRLKRRIEVDYTSFSHTHELRYVMTDVLKYAENALRANRGIKSRLSIYAIGVPLRERLDGYLSKALPPRTTRAALKKNVPVPEYERHYDLPVAAVSPERAAAIEAESWQITKRLVEAFGGPGAEGSAEAVRGNHDLASVVPDVPPDTTLSPTEQNVTFSPPVSAAIAQAPTAPALGSAPTAPSAAAVTSPLAEGLGDLAAFLPLAAARDRAGQRAFARSIGLMPDAVADKINTVAGDIIGDIVLEEDNGVYILVEDYIDILTEEGVL